MRRFVFLFPVAMACYAQWTVQQSNTTADLRGIDSLGHGVAWASGTHGAILRTRDGGARWEQCAIPPGAEHLDFRGIQAINGDAAVVMSAGPADLSRVYETHDGCRNWELLLTNPDPEGFWDAILYDRRRETIFVLGDPVKGGFVLYSRQGPGLYSRQGNDWRRRPVAAISGQAAFAASNSNLIAYRNELRFVTGGTRAEFIGDRGGEQLPFAAGESSGAFSVAAHLNAVVVVGGDYKHPGEGAGTGAFSVNAGRTFAPARTMPNGYRSAVAYDAQRGLWIAVGLNGTDASRNGGRDWFALRSRGGDAADSDKNWNAVSPPFAVGPGGRIGRLRLQP